MSAPPSPTPQPGDETPGASSNAPAAPAAPAPSSAPAAGPATPGAGTPWRERWQRFVAAALKAFHAYATWLVSISWSRFIVLSVLLLVVMGIVHDKPPLTWTMTEQVEERVPPRPARPAKPSPPPAPPKAPAPPSPPRADSTGESGQDLPIRIERPKRGEKTEGLEISIGKEGIRITPRTAPAGSSASAAGAAAPSASASASADGRAASDAVQITLPPGSTSEAVREAVEEARDQIQEAIRIARTEAEEARREAEQARREAEEARDDAERALADSGMQGADAAGTTRMRVRKTRVGIGDFLMQLTVLWVLGSALIKATYKGRMQAERKAARATEAAEAESLRRQVVEARMAAMQAQVEPHFLFNTLASIDHLIETDPARASQMQRNLIALLRASMPTMREAGGGGAPRELAREMAVIRPYLEILKVRMEERLNVRIDVPEGLLSAEFPPMMIQGLVENAIKHGLEPKAEGGELLIKAEIVHGKLEVTVADTGLGFGKAGTAGTGVGLANIRERLALLYGAGSSLTVSENVPAGTRVTVAVPYRTVAMAAASSATTA